MLTPNPRLKSSSTSENLLMLKRTPIWFPVETEPSLMSSFMDNVDPYLITGIPNILKNDEPLKRKKEKALLYHRPPGRKWESMTHHPVTNVVLRQSSLSPKTKKKDIDNQLLPKTDFSFLKYLPVYRPQRKVSMEIQSYPLPIKPYGRFVFANGDKYEGQYAIDPKKGPQYYGVGKYLKPNGSIYMGNWFAGKLSGPRCFMVLPTEMIKYRGEMKDGQFHGYGIYGGPDGLYQGWFHCGMFAGKGRYIDHEGFTWIGNFQCHAALGLNLDLEIVQDTDLKLPTMSNIDPVQPTPTKP